MTDSRVDILMEALRTLSGDRPAPVHGAESYTGSTAPMLGLTTPELRQLAKTWLASNRDLEPAEILDVLDDLFAEPTHEAKTLASLIFGYSQAARRAAGPGRVQPWLGRLVGWAEIDALCYNTFTADDLLARWSAFSPWLGRLATDQNINKRRASLVFLTKAVGQSDDPRLAAAAFANLGRLQAERSPLITKAVSWLLRSLLARHSRAVVDYIERHRTRLPSVAVREVANKLATGRKVPAARKGP